MNHCKTNCTNCIHQSICNVKENFAKLTTDINVMAVYSSHFSVTGECTQYKKRMIPIKFKKKEYGIPKTSTNIPMPLGKDGKLLVHKRYLEGDIYE